MIAFTVYGRPMPAGSKRVFTNPKTGKPIVTDDNPKAKPWKQEVAAVAAEAMRNAGHDLYAGPLQLRIDFYRARPKSHYTARGALRPSAPRWPITKPDSTKLTRGLEDACSGVVWRDDALIVRQVVSKHYGTPERAVVVVAAMESGVHILGEAA